MAKDHSEYLDERFELFRQQPHFPTLRVHPAMESGEMREALSAEGEHLLLVLHCGSAELLVVSSKRIVIYKVPHKSSTAASVGKFVGMNILVNIPVVGELYEAGEKIEGVFHGMVNLKHWLTPGDRREAEQRKKDHMPPRGEGKEMVWDLHDDNVLALIAAYRDRILLENSFDWKILFTTPIADPGSHVAEITIAPDGIHFTGSTNLAVSHPHLAYAQPDWSLVPAAEYLLKKNKLPLKAAGWVAESDGDRIALKRKPALVQKAAVKKQAAKRARLPATAK